MSRADIAAAILWIGATFYALFGGADFGGGFWDLVAGWDDKGARPRNLIQRSLTPVWEANHVWLIFILVVLWTAFPPAFSAIMTTLYVPITVAAFGIVLRGSGFAFRKSIEGLQGRRAAGATFALSSVLTPFFMGCVVGAIAAGNVPAGGNGAPFSSWIQPLPLLIGAMFVATGAYLSAVFLVGDARRAGEADMERYFVRRALTAGAVAALGFGLLAGPVGTAEAATSPAAAAGSVAVLMQSYDANSGRIGGGWWTGAVALSTVETALTAHLVCAGTGDRDTLSGIAEAVRQRFRHRRGAPSRRSRRC